MWSKILTLVLLARLITLIIPNLSLYTTPFNAQKAQDRYFNSAYIKGDKADYILSDGELYATEGYFLISQGKDIKKLTPGHPPLGKYLIGLSIKLFNNPYWFNLTAALLTIFVLFHLTKLFFNSSLPPPLISLIFTFEPLFTSQFTKSMLDIYLLLFSLSSLYFYLKWLKNNQLSSILISQFFLGLSFAGKFFPTSAPLATALLITTLLTGSFARFKHHILGLLAIPAAFMLAHFTFFIHHPSLIDFARYQRFLISWWAGSPQVNPGLVWDLIFFNRWHTWWGAGVISTPTWWLGWPISITLSLLSLPILKLTRLYRQKHLPPYLWLVLCLLMFSFEAIYPRHLLIILPASYLLSFKLLSIIRSK